MACLQGDLLHEQWLTHRLTQTTGRIFDQGRVGPPTPPGDPRAEIREGTRKPHLSPIGNLMHIDRANQVTVSREATGTADPISAFGLVFVPRAADTGYLFLVRSQ